jgi:hypothetical protein
MPEENGQAVAVVPTGLGDDQLLAVAAAAERRVEAIMRIKILSLKVTNAHDWNDQGGKPYMAVSGAEKVARLFGISWRLDPPVREDYDDGHFDYLFKGYFSMGTAEIEVIGTRGSQDPFFGGSKDKPIPPSEIDRNDVKKGAMTNCLGNGISRLLGIRNLTWEELAGAGIKREDVGKVTYRDSDPNATMKLPNYGRHKGQQMDDPAVPVEELRYYLAGAEKSIADPEKAKYKGLNEKMRDALKAEIAKREPPVAQAENRQEDGAGHVGTGVDVSQAERTGITQQVSDAPADNLFEQSSAVVDHHTAIDSITEPISGQKVWNDVVADKRLSTDDRASLYQRYMKVMKAVKGKK